MDGPLSVGSRKRVFIIPFCLCNSNLKLNLTFCDGGRLRCTNQFLNFRAKDVVNKNLSKSNKTRVKTENRTRKN